MAKKKITIEDLARMSQNQFAAMQRGIRSGFGELRQEIGTLRNEVGGLREEIQQGFAEMRTGFASVQDAIRVSAREIVELKARQEQQELRIRRLERKAGVAKR